MKPGSARSAVFLIVYTTLLVAAVRAQDVPQAEEAPRESLPVATPATSPPLPALPDLIARRQAAAQAESDQPVPQDTTPALRLADINDQTSRLLRLGASIATLIALYAIWIDVLPALGILGQFESWPKTLVIVPGELPVVWVTAADVVMAVLIGVLTIFASGNYLIIVTGFLFGFRAIGIGWSGVQWLVAAVTVGLGFCLQEIFANFISGIILLFERPIRIGDTVTVSNNHWYCHKNSDQKKNV